MEKKDNRRYVRLDEVETYPRVNKKAEICSIVIGFVLTVLLVSVVGYGIINLIKGLGWSI